MQDQAVLCFGQRDLCYSLINLAVGHSAATQRGLNLTTDFGVNNLLTDGSDNGPRLTAIINAVASTGRELWVPCGKYTFTTSAHITSSSNVALIGEATANHTGVSPGGCVIFTSSSAINILWFDFSIAGNGGGTQDERGPRIEHIQFIDGSGAGGSGNTVISGLRMTEIQNFYLNDVTFAGFGGNSYSTGTVSVTNGSKTVTGSGTAFTQAMNGGQLWINGYPHEINSNPSWQNGTSFSAHNGAASTATTLFLTDAYPDATNAAAIYEIDYNGYGFLSDPGFGNASNFSQYALLTDIKAWGTQYPIYMYGGVGPAYGNSRFKILGGFLNCSFLPNSIGIFLGGYTDTMDLNVSENNCTLGAFAEQAASNIFRGNYEVAGGTYSANTTCAGSPSKACSRGVLIRGTQSAHNGFNMVTTAQFGAMGTGVEVGPNVNNVKLISNTYASNNTPYLLQPEVGGTDARIVVESEGVQIPGSVGLSFGSAALESGPGAPSGACSSGLYLDTSGQNLYNCHSNAWVLK